MPPTSPRQDPLPGASPRKAGKLDDYLGVFAEGVFPTGLEVVEQGDNLLFVKRYDNNQKIKPKHDRIFRLLVNYGSSPDVPGHITVICVWGIAITGREVVIYSPFNRGDVKSEHKAMTTEEYRVVLRDWWTDSRRRR